ncbi:hypothetical protein M422DRAFT_61621 [Sphaerobolus stellatus SS14]|uniref:Major facilitator superfamily (MFS) profile domain-containing protein n=1 Tax=Sphaerobolus stellatus (strain SS14) TaxID=990650 RepID=A0A0C9TP44_SPHS4|nr:hypothetical protein M422DRAFT_61621 [Sphaerobolus stellatus SS14]
MAMFRSTCSSTTRLLQSSKSYVIPLILNLNLNKLDGDLGPAKLSSLQQELITSATTLGALFGGLVAGMLSDYSGRKPVLGIADIIFISGALTQTVCHTVSVMIGSRFLIGVGVDLAACITPLYIQELSPTRLRDRMVTLNVVVITGGHVTAYGIGAAFAVETVLLFFLPESLRILVRRGDEEAVMNIMRRIYAHATEEEVVAKVKVLTEKVREAKEIMERMTLGQRVYSIFFIAVNRRALIVGCGLQTFQQIASLFKSIGFNNPTAIRLIITATNFLFTLVMLKYIDIISRRKIMVWTLSGMIFGLTLVAISFHFLMLRTNNRLVDGTKYPDSWSALVLVSMIIFVASYATGLGNVPWQQGELFSLEVRRIGTSLATATNWGTNLIINSTYLSLMNAITPSGAFGFYGRLCLLGWVFCLFCFPETAGLSLEEVFRDGFGVKESVRIREERKDAIKRRRQDKV